MKLTGQFGVVDLTQLKQQNKQPIGVQFTEQSTARLQSSKNIVMSNDAAFSKFERMRFTIQDAPSPLAEKALSSYREFAFMSKREEVSQLIGVDLFV